MRVDMFYRKIAVELLGGKCVKCDTTENLEIDHILSVQRGGKDIANNCQLLCKKHHQLKTIKENRKAP